MQKITISLLTLVAVLPFVSFGATGAIGAVDTLSANVVDDTTVEMRASAYAYAPGTKLFFEYGPTQALGRRTYTVGASVGKAEIGYQRAYNLTQNVTYYYRGVIEGTGGTVYGETKSFVAGYQSDAQYLTGDATTQGNQGNTTVANGAGNTSSNTGNTNANTNAGQNTLTGAVGNVSVGSGTSGATSGDNASASVTQSPGGFFQRLFDSATRARPITLSVAMSPEKPKARDIVEYVVTYTNGGNQSVPGGTLAVVIPDSVVYLGDNSGGKTTLSKVDGGQKLVVPTEPLSARASRTLSVMAIAGSAVGTKSAVALASMDYINAQGAPQQISTNKAQSASPLVASVAQSSGNTSNTSNADTASASTESGSILPNSFFDWLMFLALVTGIIVIVRKIMAVYQERKKRILEESREGVPAHA